MRLLLGILLELPGILLDVLGFTRNVRELVPGVARNLLVIIVDRFLLDFSDFLGRLLVIVEFHSHDYLFTYLFFFRLSSSPGWSISAYYRSY